MKKMIQVMKLLDWGDYLSILVNSASEIIIIASLMYTLYILISATVLMILNFFKVEINEKWQKLINPDLNRITLNWLNLSFIIIGTVLCLYYFFIPGHTYTILDRKIAEVINFVSPSNTILYPNLESLNCVDNNCSVKFILTNSSGTKTMIVREIFSLHNEAIDHITESINIRYSCQPFQYLITENVITAPPSKFKIRVNKSILLEEPTSDSLGKVLCRNFS